MDFFPTGLPDLSKPKFSRSNRRKTKIYRPNNRKKMKNLNEYPLFSVVVFFVFLLNRFIGLETVREAVRIQILQRLPQSDFMMPTNPYRWVNLREFGLCTLPSSEPRTCARSETWSATALPKVLTRPNLLKCYVFQHFYRIGGPGTRFFTKSLKRRAHTAVARLVFVDMIASETRERCGSTFWENVCICPHGCADLSDFACRWC